MPALPSCYFYVVVVVVVVVVIAIIIIIIIIIILTAIGLMPGGSVTKIGRAYKKWTYIARKKTYNSRKSSTYNSQKKQHISQNFTVAFRSVCLLFLSQAFVP
jgi:hypothetical protein